MHLPSLLGALGTLLLTTTASTFTPARPPSIPLAVKSPYLSAWFPAGSEGGNGGLLPGQWPSFWAGQTLGWTGLVRVDGQTSVWMGAPKDQMQNLANQTSFEYTSTSSIFTIVASDTVQLKITFLSPITPDDMKRQSLVFSYMNIDVTSLDGKNHDVQIYTDISTEWAAGDVSATAQWSFGTTSDGINYHKVWRQQQLTFAEFNDRAEWGNIYYATDAGNGATYKSGIDADVRSSFVSNGKLDDSNDTNFRSFNNNWPVFGHAVDLGSVGSQAKTTLFSIGLCQQAAIQFLGANGVQTQNSLWASYFSDELAALSFFHKDHSQSSTLSSQLDDQISRDSKAAGGDNYAILTTLATRQAFGATQLAGTQDKYYLFLKEISSDGNIQTVDVIYPAAPIFLYTNPELMKLLLDPEFENIESGHYPNKWSLHDLGTHYPNATGHPDGKDESMPVEECGNNIVMVLAYAQRSGNNDYIKAHYPVLKQWVEYLIEDSLLPAEQLSTDDFAGKLVNQTNLALKGIIGIEAMSQMAKLIGENDDANNYTKISHDYISKWQTYGINKDANPPHASITYNNLSTHGLLYNLYNDKLLDLNLVPQEVYDMQSNFYPTVKQNYGVPLDTRNPYYTKADWEIFCAAIASSDTKAMFIDDLAKWINETPTSGAFGDLYQTNNGTYPNGITFKNRPVVGGVFALLATKTSGYGYSSNKSQSTDKNNNTSKHSAAIKVSGASGSCIWLSLVLFVLGPLFLL